MGANGQENQLGVDGFTFLGWKIEQELIVKGVSIKVLALGICVFPRSLVMSKSAATPLA
jgi:hypothetical protein